MNKNKINNKAIVLFSASFILLILSLNSVMGSDKKPNSLDNPVEKLVFDPILNAISRFISVQFELAREIYLNPKSNSFSASLYPSLYSFYIVDSMKIQHDCAYIKCLIDAYKLGLPSGPCEDLKIVSEFKYNKFNIKEEGIVTMIVMSAVQFLSLYFANTLSTSNLELKYFNFHDTEGWDDLITIAIIALFGSISQDSYPAYLNQVWWETFRLDDDLTKYVIETYFPGALKREGDSYIVTSFFGMNIPFNQIDYYFSIAFIDLIYDFVDKVGSFLKNSAYDLFKLNNNECKLETIFYRRLVGGAIDGLIQWLTGISKNYIAKYIPRPGAPEVSTESSSFDITKSIYFLGDKNFYFSLLDEYGRCSIGKKIEEEITKMTETTIGGIVSNAATSTAFGSAKCGRDGWQNDPITFFKFYNYYLSGKTTSFSSEKEYNIRVMTAIAETFYNMFIGSIRGMLQGVVSDVFGSDECKYKKGERWYKTMMEEFTLSYSRYMSMTGIDKRLSEICSLLVGSSSVSREELVKLFSDLAGKPIGCDEFNLYCEPIDSCKTYDDFVTQVLNGPAGVYRCTYEGE